MANKIINVSRSVLWAINNSDLTEFSFSLLLDLILFCKKCEIIPFPHLSKRIHIFCHNVHILRYYAKFTSLASPPRGLVKNSRCIISLLAVLLGHQRPAALCLHTLQARKCVQNEVLLFLLWWRFGPIVTVLTSRLTLCAGY